MNLLSGFAFAENQTDLPDDQYSPLKDELPLENHISLHFGEALVRSTKLEKVYSNYLESSPPWQNVISVKYKLFAPSVTKSTFGLSVDYVKMTSAKSKQYGFGSNKVSFNFDGLFLGFSYLNKMRINGLYFVAAGQLGVTSEDITIGTPVGDVKYQDFNSQTSFDSYAIKALAGIRWDVWRKLGILASFEWTQIAVGDAFTSGMLGVGYGF
jgi:hypothetical protein